MSALRGAASRAALVLALAAPAASAQDSASTRSPSTARRCRKAIRPSCGRHAARSCGRQPRGPKNVSLEKCDLGLGPGVVKGAYAQLPRYFADADRVMDLESRLVCCMVTLQGFTRPTRRRARSAVRGKKSDIEALVAYVTAQSRGMQDERRAGPPEGAEAYRSARRCSSSAAARTTSRCATCHGDDDKRIRLQDLPNLTNAEGRAARPTRPGPPTACRRANCAPSSGG